MTEHAKGKAYRSAGGCNEDCLNCKYADCYEYPMDKIFEYEVIGNIHDNPELMEGAKQ